MNWNSREGVLIEKMVLCALDKIVPESSKRLDTSVLLNEMRNRYCKNCPFAFLTDNWNKRTHLYFCRRTPRDYCYYPKAEKIWILLRRYERLYSIMLRWLKFVYMEDGSDNYLFEALKKYVANRSQMKIALAQKSLRELIISSISQDMLNSCHRNSLYQILKTLDLWKKKLKAVRQ